MEEELKAKIILQKDWTTGDGLLGNGLRRGISGEGAAIMYVYSPHPRSSLPTLVANISIRHSGDCRRCAHVAVKNLVIDGNRAKLGRVLPTDSPEEPSPLVLLGNNEGQVVSGCTIRDPR